MNQCSHPAEIFPYVGITQIRYDRSKFDYSLSACSTSSLLYLSISLEDGICQAISISFKVPPAYSNILPSVEMVTTRQGINLPLICKAFFTACSIPPQQGTSMTTTVTLLMLLFAKNLRQLFAVIPRIQLGTADQRNMVSDKLIMKISISISRTVRCHQKVRILKNKEHSPEPA